MTVSVAGKMISVRVGSVEGAKLSSKIGKLMEAVDDGREMTSELPADSEFGTED